MTKHYMITSLNPDTNHISLRTYRASSLRGALQAALIADVTSGDFGRIACVYGIAPDDYPTANAEGIKYNVADGLLTD